MNVLYCWFTDIIDFLIFNSKTEINTIALSIEMIGKFQLIENRIILKLENIKINKENYFLKILILFFF